MDHHLDFYFFIVILSFVLFVLFVYSLLHFFCDRIIFSPTKFHPGIVLCCSFEQLRSMIEITLHVSKLSVRTCILGNFNCLKKNQPQ